MKIFGVLVLGILVVQTLGGKNPPKRPGPHGPPRRGPPPQKREEVEINEKGSGWGWNGPPAYESVSCVDPSAIVSPNVDPDFSSRLRLWYWTGDTIQAYSVLARMLLGRPVASQDELNQMCPAKVFSGPESTVYNFGYGRTFQKNCDSNALSTCVIATDPSTYDAALGVDIFAGYVSQWQQLVATDNSTYAIWYFCNDATYGNLQLTTTRPYASPEAVAAFVAAAQQLGIPQSQLQLSQCNTAYQGPYPAPFQNYPNGWSNNASGWGQAPSNGLNSQPSGWNAPSNGWSNNGWGGHSALVEKQSDVKEAAKLAEEKPKV